MAVHVDEAWDRHEALAVDRGVGRAGIARSDMDDLVAFEHEVTAVEIDVAAFRLVPRHQVVETGDPGRFSSWTLLSVFWPMGFSLAPAGPGSEIINRWAICRRHFRENLPLVRG